MSCEIGFYKYETINGKNFEFIDYYPINDFIKKHLNTVGKIKYEFEKNEPKKINGKLVVLI